jgi:hypothetical protein
MHALQTRGHRRSIVGNHEVASMHKIDESAARNMADFPARIEY